VTNTIQTTKKILHAWVSTLEMLARLAFKIVCKTGFQKAIMPSIPKAIPGFRKTCLEIEIGYGNLVSWNQYFGSTDPHPDPGFPQNPDPDRRF
jgi:hypothetical protein